MQTTLALLSGLLFAAGVYMLLARHLVRMLIGLVLFGNAVNLLILVAGRIGPTTPPLIPPVLAAPDGPVANPLPQALILTAIVISFSFFAFLLVLTVRASQDIGTGRTDRMRLAEPENEARPPVGY